MNTRQEYLVAISDLEDYIAVEPDARRRDAAEKQIDTYLVQMRTAAFREIANRTPKLQALVDDLRGIIDSASDDPTVSGAIVQLSNRVASISALLPGGGE